MGVEGGWGWVDGGGGCLGVPPTDVHTHAHACTCMHGKHGNFMQMAAPIGFGEIPGIPYDVIHVCMHVRVNMGRVHPFTTPHPHPPTPPTPQGGPPESFKIQ